MYFLFHQFIGVFLIVQLPRLTQSVQCVEKYSRTFPISTSTMPLHFEVKDAIFCRVDLTFHFNRNSLMVDFQPSVYLRDMHSLSNEHYGNEYILAANLNLTLIDAITTVRYICGTDKCDQVFVRETLSASIARFNTANLQQYLRNLFYTATTNASGVQCAGKVCEKDQFCKAEIRHQVSNIQDFLFTAIYTKCANETDANHSLISLNQIWIANVTHSHLDILCNRPNCDRPELLTDALSSAIEQFQLPLNNEFVNAPTKMISVHSNSNNQYSAMNFIFVPFSFLLTSQFVFSSIWQ